MRRTQQNTTHLLEGSPWASRSCARLRQCARSDRIRTACINESFQPAKK